MGAPTQPQPQPTGKGGGTPSPTGKGGAAPTPFAGDRFQLARQGSNMPQMAPTNPALMGGGNPNPYSASAWAGGTQHNPNYPIFNTGKFAPPPQPQAPGTPPGQLGTPPGVGTPPPGVGAPPAPGQPPVGAVGTDDWFKQKFDQIWQVDPRLAKEFQNQVMTEHVVDGKGLGNRMQGWIKDTYFGQGSADPNQMNAVDQKYAQWINLATAGGGGGNAPQLTPEQKYWMMKMSGASPQAINNFKNVYGYNPGMDNWSPARMTMDDLLAGRYARGLELYDPTRAQMNPDGTFKEGVPATMLQASGVFAR